MKRLIALSLLALAACKEDVAEIPTPIDMTDEALGYYCQMYVAEHAGPKAQIFLKGRAAPLWFSQVSDARAYVLDPAREADITAIYVSDLGAAESWAIMGEGNWIAADDAVFLIEGSQMGGMGTPEALPYSSAEAANASGYGGRIMNWQEIPEIYVRPEMTAMSAMDHGEHN
ncbi:copper resistance protein CopZ (plasmid) [Aestuarium zhoushanense]|nr:copper resistance protein CopZ [Aestuarium zhoushanense]